MDTISEYYEAKDREESVVIRISDSYLEALDALEKLEDDNTKLRELVKIAVKHCDSGTCDVCPIQVESGSCPYSDMARELGVKVD